MRQRFQTLFQPTGEVPLAAPSLREALPVWLIGVVASVGCLWLAHLGSPWVVPAAIAAGALALRSRRAADWLSWLPGGLVAASALEAVAPLARFGDLHYVELLALAVVVITLVRAIALENPPVFGSRADRPIAALLGLYASTLLLPGSASALQLGREAVTVGVVFYATVAIASRPGGARWAWLAFPAAAGLAGLFAISAAFRDPKGVVAVLAGVDEAWRTTGGVWLTLIVSIPLGFGLATQAAPQALRHLCTVLLNLGVMGSIALFFAGARPFVGASAPDGLADLLRSLMLGAALTTLAMYAEWNRRHQPVDGGRWLAVALTLAGCSVAVLVGVPVGGPAPLLLAIAAGVVVGALPAERRVRSMVVTPPREAAIRSVAAMPLSPVVVAHAMPRSAHADPPRPHPEPSVAHATEDTQLPQTLISVVIVAHRSLSALGPCLSSLAAARLSVPMEVVVVDNDSGDGTLDWIRREHPWIGTIASSTNVGFARGVNLGVTEACGDFLLLLNANCEVTAEALEAMCEAASHETALAAVAPMMLDHQGRPTRSCGRFPDLWMLCCDHFGLAQAFPRSRWFAGYQYGDRPLDSLSQVDWASGGCLLIPRAVWDSVGTLDESMSLYLEEVDWCRRAAGTGRKVRFVPGARVVHHGRVVSKQQPGDDFQDDLRSRVRYFRKHHGPLTAAVTKSILVTSLAIQWGLSSMRATSRPLADVYARGVNTVWMS